jgi:hypothetical protein
MRLPQLTCIAALLLATCLARPAGAIVSLGDPAPNFTKQQLDSPGFGQTTPRSLADYSDKVIVFFLLGFN